MLPLPQNRLLIGGCKRNPGSQDMRVQALPVSVQIGVGMTAALCLLLLVQAAAFVGELFQNGGCPRIIGNGLRRISFAGGIAQSGIGDGEFGFR